MLNQHSTIKANIEKYNKFNPLVEYLLPFIRDKKEVKILDVGSGAYSIIGHYVDGVSLDITHCDNQDFTEFYKRYNVVPFTKIEYQDMEYMTYQDNSFDLVVCINALDHTFNAEQAVRDMIRVCKPNGYVYISCHLDQANTGHKHYWNAKEDGKFVGNFYNFDLLDSGFEVEFIDNGGESRYNQIIAILKK